MAKKTQYDEDAGLMDDVVKTVETSTKPTAGPSSQDLLNERMVTALEGLARKNESVPTPQIPISKAKFTSPWNPTGARNRAKLARPTYINGRKINQIWHSDEEIQKFNKLKPGHYLGRKVTVWTSDTSEGIASINLQFPHKSPDEKIEMMRLTAGRDLVGLLDLILNEQAAVVPAP